ncbi:hypothetical protein QBC46DRAFT_404256 [Diplogelasinospora grovesii]|uniref:Uncharacterized protein n=1 Tax=Diplogelasinospora grovesii TaxID=303347 RepID=A0AAN6NF92_9PEZI|nr:hypothetical protein QBC46DRAFT_404256 [Diplogelasinospora grovesii]
MGGLEANPANMSNSCTSSTQRGLADSSHGQGPRTPSRPTSPAHPVPLEDYPTTPYLPTAVSGSNGHSHGGDDSARSRDTGNSGTPESSVDSTATINSVPSLLSLASRISAELERQRRVVDAHKAWLATVDPEEYAPEATWSNPTAEEHLERARLAVAWGQAAVSAAEGRLSFDKAHPNAFSFIRSIRGHIEQAENVIQSGEGALDEILFNYDGMDIFIPKTK